MKRIILSTLIIGFLAVGAFAFAPAKAKAITLNDINSLFEQVRSLKDEIASLKSLLGAQLLRAADTFQLYETKVTEPITTDTTAVTAPETTVSSITTTITSFVSKYPYLTSSFSLSQFKGFTSERVRNVQNLANSFGCNAGFADGRYGDKTEAGLRCLYGKYDVTYQFGYFSSNLLNAAKATAPATAPAPIIPITPAPSLAPESVTYTTKIGQDFLIKTLEEVRKSKSVKCKGTINVTSAPANQAPVTVNSGSSANLVTFDVHNKTNCPARFEQAIFTNTSRTGGAGFQIGYLVDISGGSYNHLIEDYWRRQLDINILNLIRERPPFTGYSGMPVNFVIPSGQKKRLILTSPLNNTNANKNLFEFSNDYHRYGLVTLVFSDANSSSNSPAFLNQTGVATSLFGNPLWGPFITIKQ